MTRVLLLLCAWAFIGAGLAGAQSVEVASLTEANIPYYSIKRGVVLYNRPDSTRPYLHLKLREPVQLVEEAGHWLRVRTRDGAEGFVYAGDVSNVWIRVSKRTQTLFVYRGTELVREMPADFGQNVFADKERRGNLENPDHWRTPTGVFFVANKNARSQYYKALVLNYPNAEDAERGLEQRYITEAEYDAIVRAEEQIRMPPMNTALGGWIEIHGQGTGARSNWTQGCVAIENRQIDAIWNWVHVGTPVLIEP